MNLAEKITQYRLQYDVLDVVDLNHWFTLPVFQREAWIRDKIQSLHKSEFVEKERIIFTLTTKDDHESPNDPLGSVLKNLTFWLNKVDITNYFVVVLTNSIDVQGIKIWMQKNSTDDTKITVEYIDEPLVPRKGEDHNTVATNYMYGSSTPVKIAIEDLSSKESFLLTESKTFCIYPWVHLHAYPTGAAYPCCHSEMRYPVGDCRKNTLEEIWNSSAQKKLRRNMLDEKSNPACNRCYEQEVSGFFSGRQSANKHHGHHIKRVHETQEDGTLDRFEMTYWDIRFSNLCNLRCRSCGHIFSSQWYQDQVQLAGKDWAQHNQPLNIAGRTPDDMWQQLLPHIDYVEQIYFAGGEPLLMDEHYMILEELVKRSLFHVRLIYNTNFTNTKLKNKSVFDYWKLFNSVSVGASLDGANAHAEYIRKGTIWDQVERNRREMLNVCPQVDFYISPTLSIMNALHLPDFHRDWVERGFILPKDLNINILQDPPHYRIDMASAAYKQEIQKKYQEHIEWLKPHDALQRARVGFESAINFMNATDNSHLIDTFWSKTKQLDVIRKENILEHIPELAAL